MQANIRVGQPKMSPRVNLPYPYSVDLESYRAVRVLHTFNTLPEYGSSQTRLRPIVVKGKKGAGHMQAVLKGLHCTDIANIETYLPEEEDNFGFVLRLMVGPLNGAAEESFDITVCTPKWLTKTYQASEVLLGLHKLIVFTYDYRRVRGFIERFLMRCSGDTWKEVAQKVSLLGQWEFENYRTYFQ